ncbi:MAG: hypothetical protein IPL61_08605 [Myxococcales bacterium]|nr:hypothetical protein [Myxococcales bacterium]
MQYLSAGRSIAASSGARPVTPGAWYRLRSSSTSPNSVITVRRPRRAASRAIPSSPRTATGNSRSERPSKCACIIARIISRPCVRIIRSISLSDACIASGLSRSSSSFFMLRRASQKGLSLAIRAALVFDIRPATLPAHDRSGQPVRNQVAGIDQLSAVAEDPHPLPTADLVEAG